jgi:transcriptional regulator with XRE-family HTH domain
MIKRIKSLISVKNLSSSQFADLLGVQRSNISHILSGRNKPSLDFILKITEHFPTVSIEWLLKGEGEMFYKEENATDKSSRQLDILVEDAVIDEKTINEKLDIPDVSAIDSVKTEEYLDNDEKKSNLIEEDTGTESKDLATPIDKEEIEQVMVLYKNGSFRVYTP